jgi:enoyl-CoA hydratase
MSAVTTEKQGEVWVVTLDRPEVRNAVDSPTAQALHAAFLAFEDDPDARVAVFHGAHGHFCAGWDLQYGARLAASGETGGLDLDFTADDPRALGPMGPSRLQLSKPVIAAVSGAAVAGGMELALWADMRVVGEGAVFGIFCRRFGVPLIDLGTIRLPRLIGHSRAMDLILTGRPVEAREALEMGIANRLVPKGEARAHAIALAKDLAAFPQMCLRNDKRSALAQWDLGEEDAIIDELMGGRKVIDSGETVAGATRFAGGAGRHGSFKG